MPRPFHPRRDIDWQVRLVMPQEEEKIELNFYALRDRGLLDLQTSLPMADHVNGLLVHMDFNTGLGLVVVIGFGFVMFGNSPRSARFYPN